MVRCGAVCCGVLQRVEQCAAVCCGMLQCVADLKLVICTGKVRGHWVFFLWTLEFVKKRP